MAMTRKGGSLSADLNGWCMGPDIAVDSNGDLVGVWKQDYTPSNGTGAQIRVKKYSGGAWAALGGGLNFSGVNPAHFPRPTMLGTTPYLCWLEATGGVTQIHVAHWNGSTWIHDTGAGADGAVASKLGSGGTEVPFNTTKPSICNVGGVITLAYFNDQGNGGSPRIAVKTLAGGVWSTEATITGLTFGDMAMCLDLAVGTTNPWLMLSTHAGSRAIRVWERTAPGTWVQRGGDLRNSTNNRAPQASMKVAVNTPYVAFAEGTIGGAVGEMGGPDQVYVKHWNGSAWVADGGANNVSAAKHAGRPDINTDGTDVWLAWAESARGEKAKLYTRKLSGGSWGAVEGPHNADPNYSADSPRLAARAGVANVIWTERASGNTKHVYVAGSDAGTPLAPAAPLDFPPDGQKPALLDNQWQFLGLAKGARAGVGVSDEGYSTTLYSPGLNRSLFFGKYHNGPEGFGEQQNALLGLDFVKYRIDPIEIADGDYSEHLHAHGHDAGNYGYDSLHDTLIARGALSLVGNTQFLMYQYDPVAGRGKRMMPLEASADVGGADGKAFAFDRVRDQVLMWNGNGGTVYKPHTNAVLTTVPALPGVPSNLGPGLIHHTALDLYIMVGGTSAFGLPGFNFNSVWTMPGDLSAGWTLRTTTGTPPSPRHNPNVELDPVNGVVMVAGGRIQDGGSNDIPGLLDSFILDPSTTPWSWSSAGTIPYQNEGGHLHGAGSGKMMVYDTSAQCFLLRNDSAISHWYRYKYVATGFSIPTRTWIARTIPQVPTGFGGGGKHMRPQANLIDNKIYNCGGDWNDFTGQGSAQQEMYSYDLVADVWERVLSGCPTTTVFPAHPDQVVWCWDTLRSRFTFLPGWQNGGVAENGEACGFALAALRQSVDLPGFVELETVNVNDFQTGDKIAANNQRGNGAIFTGDAWVDGVNSGSLTTGGTNPLDGWPITVITNKRYVLHTVPYVGPDGVPSGGRTSSRRARWHRAMTFNPSTKIWTDQAAAPEPTEEQRGNHGQYDPVTDRIWRLFNRGIQAINPANWTTVDNDNFLTSSNGVDISNDNLGSEYIALDVQGRRAYAIDPFKGHLWIFNLDNPSAAPLVFNTPLNTDDGGGGITYQRDCAYPCFDSSSRVLLWPYVRDFSSGTRNRADTGGGNGSIDMRIFHPELVSGTGVNQAQAWETDPLTQPAGQNVFIRGNAWCYHAGLNVLVGWGGHIVSGQDTNNPYVFLYRYASGGAPPPPPPVARRVAALTVSQGA